MKTIIHLSLVSVLSFFSFTFSGQCQEAITFYQSIQTQDANLAILECDGPVEVKIWEEDYIMVHTNISCTGVKANALRQLAVKGRYDLVAEMGFNNFLTISQPHTARAFKVNHQAYQEQIQYTVYIPAHLDVEIDAPNDLVADHEPVQQISEKEFYIAYQK